MDEFGDVLIKNFFVQLGIQTYKLHANADKINVTIMQPVFGINASIYRSFDNLRYALESMMKIVCSDDVIISKYGKCNIDSVFHDMLARELPELCAIEKYEHPLKSKLRKKLTSDEILILREHINKLEELVNIMNTNILLQGIMCRCPKSHKIELEKGVKMLSYSINDIHKKIIKGSITCYLNQH